MSNKMEIKRQINVFDRSSCTETEYRDFLTTSYNLMSECVNYMAPDEDINSLELTHLIPEVPETVLAIKKHGKPIKCSGQDWEVADQLGHCRKSPNIRRKKFVCLQQSF